MAIDRDRPMNHFFDDDPEYGEMLNWMLGTAERPIQTLSERPMNLTNMRMPCVRLFYSSKVVCEAPTPGHSEYDDSDGWDDDLPDDARYLPPGMATSCLTVVNKLTCTHFSQASRPLC